MGKNVRSSEKAQICLLYREPRVVNRSIETTCQYNQEKSVNKSMQLVFKFLLLWKDNLVVEKTEWKNPCLPHSNIHLHLNLTMAKFDVIGK